MILLKRSTLLLIAIRMSACRFRLFLDFVLIDKRELNPDSHKCFYTKSWKHIYFWTPILLQSLAFKLHFKSAICPQINKIFLQLFIIWHIQIIGIWIHDPFFWNIQFSSCKISIKRFWQHFWMSHNFFMHSRNYRSIIIDHFFKWWKIWKITSFHPSMPKRSFFFESIQLFATFQYVYLFPLKRYTQIIHMSENVSK